jgi:tRNA modification GTPase
VNDGLARRLADELIALDLREALEWLGEVVGLNYTDDLLDKIFSEFCIGK